MRYYFKTLLLQYFKSPFTYLSILFPLVFLFGVGQVVPISYVFSTTITLSIILIALFLFGGTILEIRKTSIIKSMSLTKLNRTVVFVANFLIALSFIVIVILLISLIVFVLTLANIEFLATDWTYWAPDEYFLSLLSGDIYWQDVNWLLFFYSIILGVLLAFSLAFLIISLSKSSTTLFLWSFFYVLVFIFGTYTSVPSFFIFGKTEQTPNLEFLLNIKYAVPNFYSNQTMELAVSNNATFNFLIDLLSEKEIIINGNVYQLTESQATAIVTQAFSVLETVDDWQWDFLISDALLFDNANLINVGNQAYQSTFFQNLVNVEAPFGDNISLIVLFKSVPQLSDLLIHTFTAPVQKWLSFFIEPLTLFDLSSLYSDLNSFMPLIMVFVFIVIGVNRFEWSIR